MFAGDAARFSVRGFWVTSGLPSDPSSICVACTHRSVSQFGEQAIDHEHRVSMSGAMGASQLPLDEVRKSVLGCVGVLNPTPATSMPQVDSHRRALQATWGLLGHPACSLVSWVLVLTSNVTANLSDTRCQPLSLSPRLLVRHCQVAGMPRPVPQWQ